MNLTNNTTNATRYYDDCISYYNNYMQQQDHHPPLHHQQELLPPLLDQHGSDRYMYCRPIERVTTLNDTNQAILCIAPIIPSINSHEILALAKRVSELGALSIAHTIVRLNGAIGEIFTDWIKKTMPDSAEKVLQQCHGGTLNESRYSIRMKGEGHIAQQIHDMVHLARLKYFKNKSMPKLNTSLHEPHKNGQLKLFL